MKFAVSALLAAAAVTLAGPASAQFAKPEAAIKYRQSVMFVMAQHFGRIGAMANGKAPYDAKVAIANAELVATMAKLPWPAFATDTEKLSHEVKPVLWKEPAKFKEHADKLEETSGKLLAAAKTEKLEDLKAAFGETARSCKSCHDAYRKD
jgi:cytochrome c556